MVSRLRGLVVPALSAALLVGLSGVASAQSTYVSAAETALGFDISDGMTEVLGVAGTIFVTLFGVAVVIALAWKVKRLASRSA